MPVEPLTKRELQVIEQLCLDRCDKQIGDALNISIPTVRLHIKNARKKLGCAGRIGLVVWRLRPMTFDSMTESEKGGKLVAL